MVIYLLKMIICGAAFYALYALIFQREKMLVFSRFYLLGGLVVSFFIPFITIMLPARTGLPAIRSINEVIFSKALHVQPTGFPATGIIIYSMTAVWVVISFYFLVRFVVNYSKLRTTARNSKSFCIDDIKVVLLGSETVPHSFLKTVFLSKAEYEAGRIEAEVLEHELAHIRQKHSWDILWVELLQIFTWFNPMIYLYRRSIKINHELLADAAVIKKFDNVRSYQHILLQRAVAQPALAFVSSFNFYITKKRFIMLQKKYKKEKAFLLGMIVVPLIALLLLFFTEKVYAQEPVKVETLKLESVPHDPATRKDLEWISITYDKNQKPIVAEIKLKKRKVIKENISTPERLTKAEEKYGVQLHLQNTAQAPPPPPPPPGKNEEPHHLIPPKIIKKKQVSFAPPKIVKDEVESFSPPIIIKDDEVQKMIKESPKNEGIDKPLGLSF
ncbi:M56 family metallopeptidase [Niabella aquatica]